MKCYYEELLVGRDANESEIKSSYRKLALKWHPDKNPNCIELAKERFQLIQQAYEVLSDPQERAWYDNHREQILRGKNSDYDDNRLDVFQYFTVSCFKGYGDDEKGFYAIFRQVFETIAAEDAEFIDDEEFENIPKFGYSNSSYEDVVCPFYAYWSAYCTKRSYAWLCPYDIREVKDRKILRGIEKDMKKIVQKARKERNEEVRNLVSFIRKRDKRVKAYKILLEERSAFNRQKQEQNRLEQIRRRRLELEEMASTSQATNGDDYEEQLRQLVQQYNSDHEFCEDENEFVESKDLNQKYSDGLYCIACNKEFKTEKSFANHEISRKHRDNIEILKIEMKDEEILYKAKSLEKEEIEILGSKVEKELNCSEDKNVKMASKHKCKTKQQNNGYIKLSNQSSDEDIIEEVIEKNSLEIAGLDNINKEDEDWDTTNRKSHRKFKNKRKEGKNKTLLEFSKIEIGSEIEDRSKCGLDFDINQHICATCKSKFESKNKLFSHLKLTNHGVFIPKTLVANDKTKSKKPRGKKSN